MTPAFRVKLALLASASLLATVFAWNAAQGQAWPRPPFNPGTRPPGGIRGMNPPGGIGGGGIHISWRCSRCGYTAPGAIPPEICPGCGARIINGVGNGSGGGMIGNPPAGPPRNPGEPPFFIPPPSGDVSLPVANPSEDLKSSSRKAVLIGVVVGALAAGLAVLAGGAFLVIYTLRNKNSSSERRRRPRRRDEYDD